MINVVNFAVDCMAKINKMEFFFNEDRMVYGYVDIFDFEGEKYLLKIKRDTFYYGECPFIEICKIDTNPHHPRRYIRRIENHEVITWEELVAEVLDILENEIKNN